MSVQNSPKVKSIFSPILGMFLLTLFVNCSKNPIKCINGSWAQEINSELAGFVEASQTYNENPTMENCNTYKTALGNYINALEGIDDCYAGVTDFNEELDEGRQELSEIDCTEN